MALPSLILSVVAAGQLVAGADSSRPSPARAAPDSERVVRTARSAQSAFESFRRNKLPRGDSGSGYCDVRIGRYCYWRGDESDEKEPDEPGPIRERRSALILSLDTAAAALPGDRWIAGQQIRYLVEAGRTDDALRAAAACRAEAWWCSALAGYAAHSAGRFAAADSIYRAALAAMSDAERCRWLDLSDILEDELADRYKPLDCAKRETFARTLFWLGAPLYSVTTTDLFTEHLARLTRAHIAERAATIDGERWADDERTLVLRYGWPRWYTRTEPPLGSQRSPSITGHDSGMPYYYFPSVHGLDNMGHLAADDWQLNNARAVTGYAPAFARSMHEVPNQIAAFRRGESTLVVAAWDARRDQTMLGREIDAALVLAGAGDLRGITKAAKAKATGRISAIGIVDSGVVSLELLAADRHAARARVGLPARPASPVALSDLLLYAPGDSSILELSAARDSALTSSIVPASRAVGVFWETYGLPPQSEPVRYTLTIEQVGTSWMRRAAERLRLSDPTTSLRVQWQEVPLITNGVAGRGVRVDLSRLRGGHYRVELSASVSGGSASSVREIEVR